MKIPEPTGWSAFLAGVALALVERAERLGGLEHVPLLGSLAAHGVPFMMFFLVGTVAWFVSGTDKRAKFEPDGKWSVFASFGSAKNQGARNALHGLVVRGFIWFCGVASTGTLLHFWQCSPVSPA